MTTFVNDRYNVFGWTIHRKNLAAGDEYVVHSPETISRQDSANVSIWTKGRVSVHHWDTDEAQPDRVPGMFSLDRPDIPQGHLKFKALEDSEFWCINHSINKRKLPELSSFILADGEKKDVPEGTLLLICSGTLKIGRKTFGAESAVKFTGLRTVTASGPVIGLIFGSENV